MLVNQVKDYPDYRRIYLDIFCVGLKVDLEILDYVHEYQARGGFI